MKIMIQAKNGFRYFLFAILSINLIACGGDDSVGRIDDQLNTGSTSESVDDNTIPSDTVDDSTAPTEPTFSFNNTNPLTIEIGETLNNPASSSTSEGIISYFSSNGMVATVDEQGTVTPRIVGTVIISASLTDPISNQIIEQVSYELTVTKASRTITFQQTGPVVIELNQSFNNEADTDLLEEVIQYSSADEQVASIDNNGQITGVQTGITTITASVNENDYYQAASADYSVTVIPDQIVTANLFIGSSNTKINFEDSATNLDFYRTTEEICNPVVILSCAFGQVDIIDGPIVDNALTLGQDAFYTLEVGSVTSQTQKVELPKQFQERNFHDAVVFKGKLWVIAGDTGNKKNDVWSSIDGSNWTRETASAEFSPRLYSEVVVYQDKLWLIGGDDGDFLNDVWSSEDGVTWQLVTNDAAFMGRKGHQVEVFQDKLWLIAGWQTDGFINDVWSSSDGLTWNPEVGSAPFGKRWLHQTATFNDKLWIIGGSLIGAENYANDVWSSSDGINWQEEVSIAAFSARESHQVIEYQDELWLIGGYNGSFLNDIWSSPDGINWTNEVMTAPFKGIRGHITVLFENNLLLIAGDHGAPGRGYQNKIWSSNNGVNWQQIFFSPRSSHAIAEFNGQMWMLGANTQDEQSEVWSSVDGVKWIHHSDSNFPKRYSHVVINFLDKLWLIAGHGGDGVGRVNEIWSSTDGKNWVEETSATDFVPREGHRVIEFNNELWMTGGRRSSGGDTQEIYSSSDGITWTLRDETSLPKLRNHQSFVFDNHLWVLGGYSETEGSKVNDIWKSSDGLSWEKIIPTGDIFSPRELHSVIVTNNKIWLIDGHARLGDVWTSTDGIEWVEETNGVNFTGRSNSVVFNLDDHLFLVGGNTGERTNEIWALDVSGDSDNEWRLVRTLKFTPLH